MGITLYHRILIATDGSELADRAMSHGLAIAKTLQSRITFVTVTEMYPTGFYSPVPWPAEIARYEDNAKSSADRVLARAQKFAFDLGLTCDTVHIADERPADGILKACQDQACDLIVIGTHGRGGFQKLLLGSQALKVVTLSSVPVLLVR
jgi:nucleotide-binding universal stress UspA family protein